MEEDNKSTVVATSDVKSTKNYSIFKELKGNRGVDAKHVRRLMHNMMEAGNLTAEFPIVVNENMEVIDGQHRLAACTELKWPIAYRVVQGLTLNTVRGINQAGQNWSWKDYAESFAKNGTPEQQDVYNRYLNLHKKFGYGNNILSQYCGLDIKGKGNKRKDLKEGNLVIPNQEKTYRLLKQYQEIAQILQHDTNVFANSMFHVMQYPDYDHDRMVHKARLWEAEIKPLGTIEDYARLMETIYNKMMPEENRKRLY